MVDSVAREYRALSCDLGIGPALLLDLYRGGHLPATKVGKSANILIADQDLVTFLRPWLKARAAAQLFGDRDAGALFTPEIERICWTFLKYLARRYGESFVEELARHVAELLMPKKIRRAVNDLRQEQRQNLLLMRRLVDLFEDLINHVSAPLADAA